MINAISFFCKTIRPSFFFTSRSFFWKTKFKNTRKLTKTFKFSFHMNRTKISSKKKDKSLISILMGNWIWELSLGVFFLFFGFFSATSAITIIGSVADWDPLAAAVMLCWIELFTKIFYSSEKPQRYFRLMHSFKIGINLGMFVDACKITG